MELDPELLILHSVRNRWIFYTNSIIPTWTFMLVAVECFLLQPLANITTMSWWWRITIAVSLLDTSITICWTISIRTPRSPLAINWWFERIRVQWMKKFYILIYLSYHSNKELFLAMIQKVFKIWKHICRVSVSLIVETFHHFFKIKNLSVSKTKNDWYE